MLPTVEPDGLKAGVIYYDGQFDDTRLLINMAQTAVEKDAVVLNYIEARQLIKTNDKIDTVIAADTQTGKEYKLKSKVIINAAGVFADWVCQMEDPDACKMISTSQGAHIVIDRSFLPGNSALMVPKTDDGRVLFAIPWQGYIVVGTTDTPVDNIQYEPKPFDHEIEFILKHAAQYLTKDPGKEDILSTFVGLRPLVSSEGNKNTKAISREHFLQVSDNGLITITGGKWTTYRKMAEDAITKAIKVAGLTPVRSITKSLKIHGYHEHAEDFGDLEIYGSDAPMLKRLIDSNNEYKKILHEKLPIRMGEVIWAVRNEMAQTVEDFLARRRRTLFQDANAAIESAPKTAALMAKELKKDKNWERQQIAEFNKTAESFLL